jgi:hypothetical protein
LHQVTGSLLLALLLLPYEGKYARDPRLDAIREELPARVEAARKRLAELLQVEVPPVEVRLADAGDDRSGVFAESEGGVITLKTEYLVLGAFDLDRTLVHEMFHCLQRARLGRRYERVPEWAREGAALYVAGQGPERARALAAVAGSDPFDRDPLARLVNGLDGPHGLFDYYEDVAAFERVGARGPALVRKLLETDDVAAAVREVLGEDMATFRAAAAKHARDVLKPLLEEGRGEGKGVYAPAAELRHAEALARAGEDAEALAAVRGFLARHRKEASLLGDALRLEVDLLRRLGRPEHAEAARRAALDLTVYGR